MAVETGSDGTEVEAATRWRSNRRSGNEIWTTVIFDFTFKERDGRSSCRERDDEECTGLITVPWVPACRDTAITCVAEDPSVVSIRLRPSMRPLHAKLALVGPAIGRQVNSSRAPSRQPHL